jgi:hypothetical protein
MRCLDAASTAHSRIVSVPRSESALGEIVFPADSIPIGHGKIRREDVRALCHLIYNRQRGRTGRTALTLQEFEDNWASSRLLVKRLATGHQNGCGDSR